MRAAIDSPWEQAKGLKLRSNNLLFTKF